MSDEYKRLEDPSQVFHGLNDKFSGNLKQSLQNELPLLEEVEKKARTIGDFRSVVLSYSSTTKTQVEIADIFTEVFADIICSIYLAATGLDRPAQCILRRALELGISTVYLWDLPHVYYGWKAHDQDLNFTDILAHLDSPGYKTFLRAIDPRYEGTNCIVPSELQKIYRSLSNVIHGKLATFEVLLAERYSYSSNDWQTHLTLIVSIENALITLYKARFSAGST